MPEKQAIDAPRKSIFCPFPEDVVLIDNPDDALFQKHIFDKPQETLIEDIIQNGQINPITVRKRDDKVEVVAGRNRVLAFREINRRRAEAGEEPLRIKASYLQGSEEELFRVMVSENIHRRDMDPIEKADLAKRYMLMFGASTAAAAKLFRVTQQTIRDWGQLLDLPEDIKEEVATGKITPTAARQMRSLPQEQQRETLKKLQSSGSKCTVETVRKEAKRSGGGDTERLVRTQLQGRKDIESMREEITQSYCPDHSLGNTTYSDGYVAGWLEALEWMLGDGAPFDPDVAKTAHPRQDGKETDNA